MLALFLVTCVISLVKFLSLVNAEMSVKYIFNILLDKVYKTVGATLWGNVKMPVRQGWEPAMEEKFNPQVEEWDD